MARHIILELKIVKIKKINIGDNLVDTMIKARPVVWACLIFSVVKAESCGALRALDRGGSATYWISLLIFLCQSRDFIVHESYHTRFSGLI